MSTFAQQAVDRTIPPLSILVLKALSKQPSKHINPGAIRRALSISPKEKACSFDLAQELVDYITEAGRLSDDVLPPSLFGVGRTYLRLKNSKVSGGYICRIVDVCKELMVLDISGCFQVDDATVLYICEHCPHLSDLNIRNCRKISTACLEIMSQRNLVRNMISLNLGGNGNISVIGLQRFMQSYHRMPILQELHLSGLLFDENTLNVLGQRCTSLKALGIAYADVSQASLRQYLEQHGARLEKLNIAWLSTTTGSNNAQLSTEFFTDFLADACPNLKELDVTGLRNVTAQVLGQYLDARLHKVGGQYPSIVVPAP